MSGKAVGNRGFYAIFLSQSKEWSGIQGDLSLIKGIEGRILLDNQVADKTQIRMFACFSPWLQGDSDNMSPGWGNELDQQISPWDLKGENAIHFKDCKLLCRGKITLEDADFIFFPILAWK